MEWIAKLPKLNLSKNKYSQYGEEIIIEHIFEKIGCNDNYFVDIGAGGAGRNLSNTKLLTEKGWKGLSFDMDGSEGTIKRFITPDNIVGLLNHYKCPKYFEFLSVDLDSFDYDIIDRVLHFYKPDVICAEYNATLNPDVPVKLEYEEGYTWDNTNKYGFSWSAGLKLFERHGYTVVMNHSDTNIFAIKSDIIPDVEIKLKAVQNIYHPINPNAKFIPV
jgi:hypothetical protein